MIASIRRQETDILRNLHQKRDQELEPLLKKIETVEAFLATAQSLKVSHWLEIICNIGQCYRLLSLEVTKNTKSIYGPYIH